MADAFTWDACATRRARRVVHGRVPLDPRAGVDEARLTAYDDWAHDEAMRCAGLRPLLQGPDHRRRPVHVVLPVGQPGRGSRGRRPPGAHAEAAALTHEAYATYALEFHRVRRLDGEGGFTFEPYDASAPSERRAGGAGVHAELAPS